jgi:hypothetical protein
MRSSLLLALAIATTLGLGWSALATEHAPSVDRTAPAVGAPSNRAAATITDDHLPVSTDKAGVPGPSSQTPSSRTARALRSASGRALVVTHIGRLK